MKNLLFAFLILCGSLTHAQQLIHGKIMDNEGNLVSNVLVRSQKGKIFKQSDEHGIFTVSVSIFPSIIYFSKVGYKQDSVVVNDLNKITVVLQKNNIVLEEVDVYHDGFQALSKERATGSFEKFSGNSLRERISSNVIDLLDGVATGLQFDNRKGNHVLNIRGINSFSDGIIQPLIVVDNFPFEGTLDMINPNDIASVTILKDAAATSIWGARAGNGVIVISMKKASQNFKLNISSNWTLRPPEDLYYQKTMKSTDFIDMETFLFDKGYYDNRINNSITLKKTVLSPVIELLNKVKLGAIDANDAFSMIENYRTYDYRKDYSKFFRYGSLQQHYVNISGGSTRNDYGLSLGWDRETPNSIMNESNRISIRQNNLFKLIDKVTLATDLSYVSIKKESNLGNKSYFSYPYTRLFDEQGNSLTVPYLLNQNYTQTVGNDMLMDWSLNPYQDMIHAIGKNNLNHINLNATIKYDISPDIRANIIYGYEKQFGENISTYDELSFFSRNLINQFSELNADGSLKYNIPKGAIKDRSYSNLMSHRFRGQLDFSKSWSNYHSINMIAGTEFSNLRRHANGYRSYGMDLDVLTEQMVDYVNSHQTFDNLYGKSYIPNVNSNSLQTNRFFSVFINASYTFKEKYTLSTSMRRDGSNLFGVKTNQLWNPLWSSGILLNLKKENLFNNIEWLNSLKLRSTYGKSGNIGTGSISEPIMLYMPGTAEYTNYPYALITTPPNPTLKWEDVSMFNNGIDFSIFNNRVSGTIEWYDKWSKDLIAQDEIDPTTGFSSAPRNIGKIRGRGLDVKLQMASSKNRGVVWKGTVGYSFSKSTVEYYNGSVYATTNYIQNGSKLLNPIQGKELYPMFGYQSAGLDAQNGDPQGYLQGMVSKDYRKLINDSLQYLKYYGSALPNHYGFLRGSVGWKNFEITFSINYKLGHYFKKSTISYSGLYSGTSGHGDYEKRWQRAGDERFTTVPSMTYPANAQRDNFYLGSEDNIIKADVIRLQDMRISYRLSKFPIVFDASINNVCILWRGNNDGLDPDYFSTPPNRVYAFGIHFNF